MVICDGIYLLISGLYFFLLMNIYFILILIGFGYWLEDFFVLLGLWYKFGIFGLWGIVKVNSY